MTFSYNIAKADRTRVVAALRRAAEHLDRVGLYQGGLYQYSNDPGANRRDRLPCCGWGAVEAIEDNHTIAFAAEEALSLMVAPKEFPNTGHWPLWNDATGRTQAQVVEKMNETADALEAGQYPFVSAVIGVAS